MTAQPPESMLGGLPIIESMSKPSPQAVAWMGQWKGAGPALAEVRRREVRDLSDAEALAATEELLSLAGCSPYPPERLVSSGLVAQQALFHRRPRR